MTLPRYDLTNDRPFFEPQIRMSTPTPTDPRPALAGAAGTEKFNTVAPDLGSAEGWDRQGLVELMRLRFDASGALYSPHADVNINGALFGGQLIGQAIAAASHGISDRWAHSVQVSFLAPGKPGETMHYEVRTLMQGRSFQVQQVLGTQGTRTVISATVSFQTDEPSPGHQRPMPEVPPPESLRSLHEVGAAYADRIPAAAAQRLGLSRAAELRLIDPEAFLFRRDPEARLRFWVRLQRDLPADPVLQRAAIGYLSDYWMPLTPLMAHLEAKIGTGLYLASLNHTLWLHRAPQVDDWLLVDAQSPFSGNARGLTTGHFYQRDGTLLATATQECLFRGWVEDGQGGFQVPGMPAR